ncbi:hypothetical protein [Ectothiorhodospira shaposhnikovii]
MNTSIEAIDTGKSGRHPLQHRIRMGGIDEVSVDNYLALLLR